MRLCIKGHGYHRTLRCPVCVRLSDTKRNADPKRQAYRHPAYRAQPKAGICYLCGKAGADTRDHLTPLKVQMQRWGEIRDHRTLPAHRSCNSGRGAGKETDMPAKKQSKAEDLLDKNRSKNTSDATFPANEKGDDRGDTPEAPALDLPEISDNPRPHSPGS